MVREPLGARGVGGVAVVGNAGGLGQELVLPEDAERPGGERAAHRRRGVLDYRTGDVQHEARVRVEERRRGVGWKKNIGRLSFPARNTTEARERYFEPSPN